VITYKYNKKLRPFITRDEALLRVTTLILSLN